MVKLLEPAKMAKPKYSSPEKSGFRTGWRQYEDAEIVNESDCFYSEDAMYDAMAEEAAEQSLYEHMIKNGHIGYGNAE